jgi:hypothetical protein
LHEEVYFLGDKLPTCPAGGAYTVGAMNTDPTCTKLAEGHVLPTP